MNWHGVLNIAGACLVLSLIALLVPVDSTVKELKVVTQSKPAECHPVAAIGDEVSVHYTGKLENGAVFDSSVLQQRDPISFTLGAGRVIPGHWTKVKCQMDGFQMGGFVKDGLMTKERLLTAEADIAGWEQGILGMCVGEKRLLTIPPQLAYGKRGVAPQIPPDATIIFETELMSLKPKGQVGIEEQVMKTLRLLALPSLVLYIIYYLYKKYQSDTESTSKSSKDKRKKRK